jgi:tetratricopeptide (TPR) repeat protein
MAGSFSGPRLILSVPPRENRPAPITIPLSNTEIAMSNSSAKGDDFSTYGQQMRAAQELIDQGKLFEAWHELDSAIKSNPESVEANLVLSDVLDGQSKWMQSLEAAKCAVRNDDSCAQAREKLARAYFRIQNSDEALRQAQKAATLDPQSSMAHYYMGLVNEKFGSRVDQAEQFYRKAIELNGANAPALVALANLLQRESRDPAEVEKLIKAAMDADSDYPEAHLAYARLLGSKGQTKEAEKLLRTAIDSTPNDPILHADLGVVLSEGADREAEAEGEFRKAIELNPKAAYPRFVFARFLSQKRQRYDQAEEEYAEAIKLDPSMDKARIEYGFLLVRRKKYDDADAQFNKALITNPKNPLARLGLGRIKYELFKDYRGAEAELQKATVLDPKLSAAYDLQGEVMFRGLGRHADAKLAYEKAINADPKNAAAHYHLAILMLDRVKENNPQAILEALTKAVNNSNSESQYQTKLGWVQQTYFKQYKQAEDAYRKAIELNVGDSEAHLNLGLLLVTRLNQRKAGERELRTAYEQNPSQPDIKSAFERYVGR